LNYFTLLNGPSGTGKSSVLNIARQVFEVENISGSRIMDAQPGSGEGTRGLFFEMKTEKDEDGQTIKRYQRCLESVWMYSDEGAILEKLNGRNSATLAETLRSMWSGSTVHAAYRNAEAHLPPLEGLTYRIGMSIGIQPRLAKPHIEDEASGGTQRWIWAETEDPNFPREVEPVDDIEPIKVRVRTAGVPVSLFGYRYYVMGIDPAIPEEIRAATIARRKKAASDRVEWHDNPDSHVDLMQMKTAGLLVIMHNEHTITRKWWDLAGCIVKMSIGVREALRQWHGVLSSREHEMKISAQINAEVRKADALEARSNAKLEAGLEYLRKRLHTLSETRGEWFQIESGDLSPKWRPLRSELFETAFDEGWLEMRRSPGSTEDKKEYRVILDA
jgi:hypothetical protein